MRRLLKVETNKVEMKKNQTKEREELEARIYGVKRDPRKMIEQLRVS